MEVPQRALKGFQRILLKAGESKVVHFAIKPEQLAIAGEDGKMIYPKGKLVISVGGGQPGIKLPTTSNVLQQTVTIN